MRRMGAPCTTRRRSSSAGQTVKVFPGLPKVPACIHRRSQTASLYEVWCCTCPYTGKEQA